MRRDWIFDLYLAIIMLCYYSFGDTRINVGLLLTAKEESLHGVWSSWRKAKNCEQCYIGCVVAIECIAHAALQNIYIG